MNLTVVEKNQIPNIPLHYQPYVIAKFQTPMKRHSDMEIEFAVKSILGRAYAELGISTGTSDVLSFMRETLLKDFRTPKFENLTLELVSLFISNGIRGEYGSFKNQMNTINIQNIHYWISKGLESQKYLEAMKEFNRKLAESEIKEPSIEEKTARSKQALKNLFQKYRESGDLGMTPWAYYSALCDLIGTRVAYRAKDGSEAFYKTLFTDPVLRHKLDAQGEKEYKDSIAGKSNPDDIYSRSRKKDESEMEMARIITSALSKEDGLVNKKKEVALRYYFDQLIQEGKELDV